MLTARRTAGAALLSLALLGAGARSAVAAGPGGGVVCPPWALNCDVTAQDPGKPASGTPASGGHGGNGSGKAPRCTIDGKTVPCTRDDLGVFNPADHCYWKAIRPTPGPDDPIWHVALGVPADWKPGDPGTLYDVTCTAAGATPMLGGATTVFSTTGPAGGGVDVAALAQQAVRKLQLRGADIGIAPDPAGRGTVGLPVWMWNIPGPRTTGPATATATAGGVTVTATATVGKVVWDMGDGHSVTCTAPGTPYSGSYGMADSPTCGYRYQTTSGHQPDGKFPVTATTTWNVHWTGAGQTGDLTTTRASTVRLTIGEIQVLGN